MALAGGLAAGLQAGANIGFNLADRKRRSRLDQEALDRQGLLDQRYTDNVARQQANSDRTFGLQQASSKRQDAASKRQGIAAGQRATAFKSAQKAISDKEEQDRIRYYYHQAINDGAKTPADVATFMFNQPGQMTPIAQQMGISDTTVHPMKSSDGKPNFVMTGTPVNSQDGSQVLIGKYGIVTDQQAKHALITPTQLAVLAAHHIDVKSHNFMVVANEMYGVKTKYAAGRQKQADKIALEKAKYAAKPRKTVTVTDNDGNKYPAYVNDDGTFTRLKEKGSGGADAEPLLGKTGNTSNQSNQAKQKNAKAIKSQAEYDALPVGTLYIDTDGKTHKKTASAKAKKPAEPRKNINRSAKVDRKPVKLEKAGLNIFTRPGSVKGRTASKVRQYGITDQYGKRN